jgi:two-component system, NarL family, invasion response regulator UvrY
VDEPIRVMTVDDAALFRAAAHELIAATEGFDPVLEVASGAAALDWAEQVHPQLVLVDVRMPEMDGIETCLRLSGRDSSAVVVLITSDESATVAREAQSSGAVALMAKEHLTSAMLRGLWAIHGPLV